MMDTETTIQTVEEFDLIPPCEHPAHDLHHNSRTRYFIEVNRDCCEHTHGQLYICEYVWIKAGEVGVVCKKCGEWLPREDRWEIISEV